VKLAYIHVKLMRKNVHITAQHITSHYYHSTVCMYVRFTATFFWAFFFSASVLKPRPDIGIKHAVFDCRKTSGRVLFHVSQSVNQSVRGGSPVICFKFRFQFRGRYTNMIMGEDLHFSLYFFLYYRATTAAFTI